MALVFFLLFSSASASATLSSISLLPSRPPLSLPSLHSSSQSIFSQSSSLEDALVCDVLIIGAGLCGSTASFYLNQSGVNVLLLEEKECVGGCINTRQENGYLWEEGANSFQPNLQFLKFLRDIHLLNHLVLANGSLPRYIYWNEELHPLPSSFSQFYQTKLFTWRGKVSLIAGLLGLVRRKPQHEESIEEFSTRHFGKEIYYRLIEPFVSGVYAGDPSKLSMSAALKKIYRLEGVGFTRSVMEGGIVSMLQKKKDDATGLPKIPPGSLGSMKNGIQSIPLQIQKILGPSQVKTSSQVLKITPIEWKQDQDRRWMAQVKHHHPDGSETLTNVVSKAILVTTPAYVTDALLSPSNSTISSKSQKKVVSSLSKLRKTLQKIYYPPIVGVWAAYPDNAFRVKLDGFGHLIPRSTKIRTLGSIWASTLFPNRAPKGENTLVNFIGGSLDPNISSLTDEEIISQVDSDLRKIVLRPSAPPPKILGIKRWMKSIPQYERGHLSLQKSIEDQLSSPALRGLYFGGNYISGVAVGDCIQYGTEIAQKICKDLK